MQMHAMKGYDQVAKLVPTLQANRCHYCRRKIHGPCMVSVNFTANDLNTSVSGSYYKLGFDL